MSEAKKKWRGPIQFDEREPTEAGQERTGQGPPRAGADKHHVGRGRLPVC